MGLTKTKVDSLKLQPGVSLLMQTYEKEPLPDKVVIIKQNVFPDDQGGWFKENLRVDKDQHVLALKDAGIDFRILQSNSSYIAPLGKRFWHIHPDKNHQPGQNEIWTTNGTLLLGLVDLRKSSTTCGKKVKVILSQDKAIYIPSGIAHGFINPNNYPVTLTYFTDQHFLASQDTQEHRIDPKNLPFDFVEPELM